MTSNNQAIARAMDPSQSQREEIASRLQHAEITVKMAQVPDPSYTTAYKALKKIVDQQHIEGRLENGEHYITRDSISLFLWMWLQRRSTCNQSSAVITRAGCSGILTTESTL
eukprot:11165519-Ditylum_brightwellii.AAC.1